MAESAQAKKKTLAKKLASAIAEVEKLPKDGHNNHFNYDYVTEGGVVEAVAKLMDKHGILIVPTVRHSWQEKRETVTKEGPRSSWHSFVIMDYCLKDTETDEEIVSGGWPGEGMDSGDKGFYKAMTGAQKYFLLKTFMIPTGDDPEKDDGKTTEAPSKPRQTPDSTISKAQAALLHVWFDIAGVPEDYPARVKGSLGITHWNEATKAQMDAVKDKLVAMGRLAFEKDDKGKEVGYNPKDRVEPGEIDAETEEYLGNGGDVPEA